MRSAAMMMKLELRRWEEGNNPHGAWGRIAAHSRTPTLATYMCVRHSAHRGRRKGNQLTSCSLPWHRLASIYLRILFCFRQRFPASHRRVWIHSTCTTKHSGGGCVGKGVSSGG